MKLKWGVFEIKAGFKALSWAQTSSRIENMFAVGNCQLMLKFVEGQLLQAASSLQI